MTDETPQPEGTPPPASPEETPTAETKPFTYDDAVAQAGDEDDVTPPVAPTPPPTGDAPTQAAPVAAPGYAAAAPAAAATPTAAAPAERPAGIFVPKWVGIVVAAIVAALIFGGIGYAIGDSSDSSSSQNASNTFPNGNTNNGGRFPGGGQFPGYGNGSQLPNGNGSNGNGSSLPGGSLFPNGGNGTQNGNGNGNGDGTTASNAGFLGVGVQASTDGKGVEITEVASGSPADKAGLQQGDVITALDGNDVTTPAAVRSAVQAKQSGDKLSVTYTRNGQSNTVDVTLTSRSEAQSS
jgi:membrane-associated protease RseP (regulator of RpoE activity)